MKGSFGTRSHPTTERDTQWRNGAEPRRTRIPEDHEIVESDRLPPSDQPPQVHPGVGGTHDA
ncbi:hypothetical protein GCM10022399_36290 [Terrabacter ginsenosidimutans]|uniref:Uncharacterized protein n=1 Tax=Terrabacter ginsenosidimutans TaxID=490575 RepID=A0ABP7EC92_9MICO